MRKNLSNDHWFFFDKKKWIYIYISMNRTQTKGLRSKRRNSPYIFLVVTSQYQRKLVILKHFTIDWIKWLTIKQSKTTKLQRALWHTAAYIMSKMHCLRVKCSFFLGVKSWSGLVDLSSGKYWNSWDWNWYFTLSWCD